jgi:malonyl-CoA O-methyltransferase
MASPQTPSKMSAPIDPARVRQLFADPARSAPSDFLRREIAGRMFDRLALVKTAPQPGAGRRLRRRRRPRPLQKTYPAAQVLGLDAVPAMLADAGATVQAPRSSSAVCCRPRAGVDLVCGDFGQLPLGPNSLDLVWSNLALHWHPQPDRVFAEWRRVLRVDGLLMFSNFGPDTFRELRNAFAAMDETPHTLPFVDMHDFGDQLVEAASRRR